MLFAEIRAQIATEVSDKELLIARLQGEVAQLQNHAQEVQSSEAAAETAVTQVETAIAMLLQIDCPEGLKSLEKAIKEKFKEAKESSRPRKKAPALSAQKVQDVEPEAIEAAVVQNIEPDVEPGFDGSDAIEAAVVQDVEPEAEPQFDGSDDEDEPSLGDANSSIYKQLQHLEERDGDPSLDDFMAVGTW